jgi:hypothetical protein
MKKIFIFLFHVIFCTTLIAQEYQYPPMPTKNATWNVFHLSEIYKKPHDRIFSTDGDTLINNENWTKIVLTGKTIVLDQWGEVIDINTYGPLYQGAYKETDKVVLFCAPDGTITTLYDFNLQVGDTVKFLHFEGVEEDPFYWIGDTCLIVKQIDSLLVHNYYRKCIIFKRISVGIEEEALEEKWIEGIGSVHGILFPLNLRPLEIDGEEDLTCFFEDNTLIWRNGFYKTCELLTVSSPTINDQIEIYPNPASQFFNVKIPYESENFISKIELFDMMGNNVLMQSYKLHDDNYQINISNIKSGVYVLIINIDEKSITKKLIIY